MKNEYDPARWLSWQSWKLAINNLDGNNWGSGDAVCHSRRLSLCFSTQWTWGSEICLNCLTSISAHTSWLMPAMFNNDSPYHMCTQAQRTAGEINQARKTLTVDAQKKKSVIRKLENIKWQVGNLRTLTLFNLLSLQKHPPILESSHLKCLEAV